MDFESILRILRDGISIKSVIVAVLVVPGAYIIYSLVNQYRRAAKMKRALASIPGYPKHPIFGNLLQHPRPGPKVLPYLQKTCEQFPKMSLLWFGPFMPVCQVYHPDTMKVILKTAEPKTIDSNASYMFLKSWLGDGLLLASGSKWFRNRHLLTPAFHFEILKPYLDVYHQATEVFIKKAQETSERGESMEIYSQVSLLTLDIILKCAFSYNADIQTQGKRNPYVATVNELTSLVIRRLYNPILHNPWFFALSPTGWKFRKACKYVHQVSEEIIAKRKAALAESGSPEGKRYLDFLDILLVTRDEKGQSFTDLEIRNEVDTFLFEGHDTTASGLTWTLYELAEHPDIQEKARQEVLDLASQREDPEHMLWDDLSKLTYLTQCIRESLRLHPPVPGITRQLSQDLIIDEHTMPKGLLVKMNIHMLHHNPVIWGDDHMEYKPERFHPDIVKTMDPYAFVPFSAGPRNCIGQNFAMNEEKVILSQILQKFELRVDPNHKVVPVPEMVTRPENGVRLFFTPL